MTAALSFPLESRCGMVVSFAVPARYERLIPLANFSLGKRTKEIDCTSHN
jgi:hypothetical protein